MKRRLQLIIALVHRPRILFLDEPTVGLDIQTRTRIWDYIRGLSREQGLSTFMTTHYLEEADRLSDIMAVKVEDHVGRDADLGSVWGLPWWRGALERLAAGGDLHRGSVKIRSHSRAGHIFARIVGMGEGTTAEEIVCTYRIKSPADTTCRNPRRRLRNCLTNQSEAAKRREPAMGRRSSKRSRPDLFAAILEVISHYPEGQDFLDTFWKMKSFFGELGESTSS